MDIRGDDRILEVISIAIALAAGIPAGYALARSKLRGMGAMGFLLLALSTAMVALGLRLSGQRFVDVMRRS